MDIKKTAVKVSFIVLVSYVGIRAIAWGANKLKASTNPTVQKAGRMIAGG